MRLRLSEFDPSAYLDNDEVIAEYLTAALHDGNPDVFLAAVGDVAKASRDEQHCGKHRARSRKPLQGVCTWSEAPLRHRAQSAAKSRGRGSV